MYRFVILAFVALVSADIIIDSQCPDVTRVDGFNLKSYGNGVWYEVARYPNNAEKNGKCGSTEYKLDGDVVKVKNFHVDHNKAKYIEGTHKLASDAGGTGKLIVSLPYGADGASIDVVLNILAIDYDNFFIGYYCKYDETSKNRKDFAWILSRSKTLSAETRAIIDKVITDSKFLKAENFIWSSFTDEDCRVDA